MSFFPDVSRLRFVHDVSPLSNHPFVPHEATPWHVATFIDPGPVHVTDRSITVTVIANRFLTWYRTYTRDGRRPPVLDTSSRYCIQEWSPAIRPTAEERRGFFSFGPTRYKSISWLDDADHVTKWSEQARRHLKVFRKTPGLRIRPASLDELIKPYATSQVPYDLQEVFVQETNRHLAAHPQTIDVMAVEHETMGIVAGFVGANCDAAKQSIYLLGFFVPEAAKMYPMMGLFDWWHARAKQLGYLACNFGTMVGPRPVPIDSMIGFSNFKTHFGITRIWQPGILCRFSRASSKRS